MLAGACGAVRPRCSWFACWRFCHGRRLRLLASLTGGCAPAAGAEGVVGFGAGGFGVPAGSRTLCRAPLAGRSCRLELSVAAEVSGAAAGITGILRLRSLMVASVLPGRAGRVLPLDLFQRPQSACRRLARWLPHRLAETAAVAFGGRRPPDASPEKSMPWGGSVTDVGKHVGRILSCHRGKLGCLVRAGNHHSFLGLPHEEKHAASDADREAGDQCAQQQSVAAGLFRLRCAGHWSCGGHAGVGWCFRREMHLHF
jgi:hypothetical protein